jgi:glycosyltransferase involved in cell wall biosynthesis
MEEIKIAMYGPGFGHNIIPFLDFFQDEKSYRLLYIYRGKSSFPEKYDRIRFFKYAPRPTTVYSLCRILNSSYKLIWFHRGGNLLTLSIFLLIRRKGTLFNLNIWGEETPRKILKRNLVSRLLVAALKRMDFIQTNWYGTYSLMKRTALNNIVMLPWGLEDKYFEKPPENVELHDFTSVFLKDIPPTKFMFFYAKSIAYPSRHDLVIFAVNELVREGINNFIVYFWLGNNNDAELYNKYRKLVDEYALHPYVRFVEYPLLEYTDYRIIYERVDCGLQIAAQDQLSTTLTETMAFRKEIIATSIEPYLVLEEKFGLKLDLVHLDSGEIAGRMKKYLSGYRTNPAELELRYRKFRENYNFKTNISRALDFFIAEKTTGDGIK